MQSMALQLLLSGIGTGSIYALIALGFNVIFKSTGALNFAQGEWVMLGGMAAAAAYAAQMGLFPAVSLALVVACLIGIISERLVIAPLRASTPMLITMISIGLAICTKSAVMLTLGKNPAGYPGFSGDAIFHLWGASVPMQTLWIIGITAFFMVLTHLFFEHTIIGKAMRAVAADREAASLVGINVKHAVLWSFAFGALAGGLAGVIITPLTFTSYDQGTLLGFKGFCAAMLGGVGNIYGAVIGGILLGLLESFAAGYVSSHFKDAVAFVVLLAILFIRPSGLLGRAEIDKV